MPIPGIAPTRTGPKTPPGREPTLLTRATARTSHLIAPAGTNQYNRFSKEFYHV